MSSEHQPDQPGQETLLRVKEAAGMRAMAHPARLAALQQLMMVGAATATELGKVAGLSPSAMSYHLRSLERAGMIETAPSRGDGRERVWRSNATRWTVDDAQEDRTDETRAASLELIEALLALEEIDTRSWLSRADEPGWFDNGFFIDTTIIATREELFEVAGQIAKLLDPLSRTARAGTAPADAVWTRAMFRGFPSVAVGDTSATKSGDTADQTE